MTGQALSGRRIGDFLALQQEILACMSQVNTRWLGVDRLIRINDVHCKLETV